MDLVILSVVLCLEGPKPECQEVHILTTFETTRQCESLSQFALVEALAAHPNRRVRRYRCHAPDNET